MSPEYEEGLVSVIIPVYNRAQFIARALDSIVEQVYRPIEVVVVDDGSEDNTTGVVDQWDQAHTLDEELTIHL